MKSQIHTSPDGKQVLIVTVFCQRITDGDFYRTISNAKPFKYSVSGIIGMIG